MTLTRFRSPTLLTVGAFIATYVLLYALWRIGAAHADPITVLAPAAAEPAPTPTWVIVVVIATGFLSLASTALHFIAPRTKNTWDDGMRDKVDEILAFIRQVPLPAQTVVNVSPVESPAKKLADETRDGAAKLGGGAALLLLACFGLATVQVACDTGRARTANGLKAGIDCTAPEIAAVVKDLGVTLEAWVLKHVSGDGRTINLAQLKRDAVALEGEAVGSCALVTALAALANPTTQARTLLPAKPAPTSEDWTAAYLAVKDQLGVGAVALPR